jgi:hypothetical protein
MPQVLNDDGRKTAVADKNDLTKDIARMLVAARDYRAGTVSYGCQVTQALGIGEDDDEETVAAALRKALGLPACKCSIDGGPGEVIPLACPVHGIPCAGCGNFDGCPEDCTGEPGDPVGTVTDLRTGEPRTVARNGGALVLPALRLDAEGCRVLRQIIGNELPEMAEARAEIAEDEAERLAHAAWREGE